MNGYIRHTLKFEDRMIVMDEDIDCLAERFTSISFQVIGDTPIMIGPRPWSKEDGIYTIELEAGNLLDYKVPIVFTNNLDKRVAMNSSRLVDTVFQEVNKVCN